jgi:putative DNA methylase
MGHALSMRGIAMMWNWYEQRPDINWTGAYLRNILGVAEAVEYLSQTPGTVRVVLDDAAELSRVEGERFDVVVTDPPYADDVPMRS